MKRNNIRNILTKYSIGGNAFILYDFLLDQKQKEVNISQDELAKALHKTRPSIQKCLELLEKEGFVSVSYGKIKILGEING